MVEKIKEGYSIKELRKDGGINSTNKWNSANKLYEHLSEKGLWKTKIIFLYGKTGTKTRPIIQYFEEKLGRDENDESIFEDIFNDLRKT